MSNDLFSQDVYRPLAARMRPDSLENFYGQQHLIGPNRPLREAIESGTLHSMVFWGPPGVGKTTLAKIIAARVDAHFESISAVLSGVKDIRASIAKAEEQRDVRGRKTILFVDEVHRFNKSQQDAFLPFVEDGTVVFVGATTENPSFELNNALLSRCRVYVLKTLSEADIKTLVQRAIDDNILGLGGQGLVLEDKALSLIANAADGDARRALNLLEIASDLSAQGEGKTIIDQAVLEQVLVGDTRRFDKGGEYFYDQISALHKSIRGSSTDASLYWLCRMLDGGCDPLYLARRLARIASEDIGNADPRALEITLNAWSVQERLGSPEGELALAQAVAYLAVAAKSNAVYSAFNAVMADVKSHPSYDVPMHLRNAPTRLMKDLDYGKNYQYAHNHDNGYVSGEKYLPDELEGKQYYFPTDRGLEKKIGEKLDYLRSLDDTGALNKNKDNG
ncbi:MAG TPA: replication-associated recombination protein A [Porticoccaceae bacterium]|nr:replication-associated recombination protein A [Porticoccaceae bacterium]HIG66349.1 replication-associated recombination protein A [Porticoccaceae bacterium]